MKGVEFYSFQADEYAEQLKEIDKSIKIHNLAKHFNNFEDTACAMKCMDLIISTDNVVMNLAGALGIKTYGLFNVFTESRWYKTTGEDLGWYKSVKPFQAKTFNDWTNLIKEVKFAIQKDFNL
jgi:ADP-heptose:LPS heptosyltransferase